MHQEDKETPRTGTCRIRVVGALDRSWSLHLEGMTVTVERFQDHEVTTLYGEEVDHEALEKVVKTLRYLGLPPVSVERSSARPSRDDQAPLARPSALTHRPLLADSASHPPFLFGSRSVPRWKG